MFDANHILSLKPILAPPTRRTILKTSLSIGFCAAVSPVSAETITTSADALDVAEVKVKTADGDIPAYRAMPASGGPFPTVLVIHEAFGVHEHIKDICRRWAKLGYYAIAPELFARQGDAAAEKDMQKLMGEIVGKKPDAEAASDLDATLAFAKASGSADLSHAAVTGFCWGGRQVWLYAVHNPSLKAAVAWYGPLGGEASPLRPRSVLDVIGELKVPMLGLYGGKDQGIPQTQVEQARKELEATGTGSKIVVYQEAGHAFNADYRPSYVKSAADAGWKEATAWLKSHGA